MGAHFKESLFWGGGDAKVFGMRQWSRISSFWLNRTSRIVRGSSAEALRLWRWGEGFPHAKVPLWLWRWGEGVQHAEVGFRLWRWGGGEGVQHAEVTFRLWRWGEGLLHAKVILR